MKKAIRFLFIPALIFSATMVCQAQEKFTVGVSMGQVYPLNEFKSVDPTSPKAGYAQTGFTLNVDGDYFIHNRFSLSLRFHLGNAPINQSVFKERLNNELKDYFSASDTVQYDINYWQWVSPLIGCKFNYPIILNKVYVEAGIFTGVNFTYIPDQNLVFNDKENKQLVISQNIGNTDISVPFALNAGFRFRINKSVQLKVNAEYFQTKASYSHVTYTQKENSTENIEIAKYKLNVPIQTLNATIGLVYNF
jgi:hypothetical protein